MEFCPKCGSRLETKKTKKGKEASLVLVCPKCEYKKQLSVNIDLFKTNKLIQHDPQQFVTVLGKGEQKLRTLPTIRIECPKCGKYTVYVWQVQTRGTDESSTQFLRCTKCDYTFRECS